MKLSLNQSKYGTMIFLSVFLMGVGPCPQLNTSPLNDLGEVVVPEPTGKYLYVSSGACVSPALATAAGNKIISKTNLESGLTETFYNFSEDPTLDLPGGMIDYGNDILVAVNPFDNSIVEPKQIVRINKFTKQRLPFYQNAAYLPAGAANTVRGMAQAPDGGIFISKSSGVEKINPSNLFKIANYSGVLTVPYLNGALTAMGATACLGVTAAANSMVNNVITTPSGKIIASHTVAAQNKLAVVKSIGGNVGTDCLASVQGMPVVITGLPATVGTPAVNHIQNAMVLHSRSGKLLVAMTGTASNSNSIIAYTYNDTTGALTAPAVAYYGVNELFQPTAMVEDTDTGDVYVASYGHMASGVLGFIQKFNVDATTGVMTDAGTFMLPSGETKCVSSMLIGH